MDTSTRKNPQLLRAKLLRKGFTIRSFAAKFDFSEGTVHSAMRSLRDGPKSRAILAKINEVARVA